eukprot:3835866-Rhodomonas_salina.1
MHTSPLAGTNYKYKNAHRSPLCSRGSTASKTSASNSPVLFSANSYASPLHSVRYCPTALSGFSNPKMWDLKRLIGDSPMLMEQVPAVLHPEIKYKKPQSQYDLYHECGFLYLNSACAPLRCSVRVCCDVPTTRCPVLRWVCLYCAGYTCTEPVQSTL